MHNLTVLFIFKIELLRKNNEYFLKNFFILNF